MAEVEFTYNGIQTNIKCEPEETMKKICDIFCEITGKDYNNLIFTYHGEKINEELIFLERINVKDRNSSNLMCILVNDKETENRNNLDSSAPIPIYDFNQNSNISKINNNGNYIMNDKNELRNKIDLLNKDIKEIIRVLNEVIEKMELYYKMKYDNINNYNNINYYLN